MKKSLTRAFFTVLMISGLFLVGTIHFGLVQASTDVPSIISSDTTWTKAGSPYELKGPVLVNDGVTLTIEAGATVNLNDYYIQVEGTFSARGSDTDQIQFNSGQIIFTESSDDWNEQTGSGCIIENANLSHTQVDIGNSPKINKNSICEIHVEGSPTITYNTIIDKIWTSGSPEILHNYITNSVPGSIHVNGGSPTISHNSINCRLIITEGSPIISHNTLNEGIHADSHGGDIQITDNIINIGGNYYSIFVKGPSATISNNTIIGKENEGICLSGPYSYYISDNIISNCSVAITASNPCPITIEKNKLSNNIDGIRLTVSASAFAAFGQVWKSPPDFPLTVRNNFISDNSGVGLSLNHPSATVVNNSITNNYIGITFGELVGESPSPLIMYNNIYANEYNFKSEVPNDLNATYNWWGTTDIPAINQTIYDVKYDFNSGTVNFVPFLTETNTKIPEFPSGLILAFFLVGCLAVVFVKRKVWG